MTLHKNCLKFQPHDSAGFFFPLAWVLKLTESYLNCCYISSLGGYGFLMPCIILTCLEVDLRNVALTSLDSST